MGGKLNRVTRKCVDALYRFCINKWGNVIISYLPVQKQTDGHSCGLFAIAFVVEVLYDKTSVGVFFAVDEMRSRLINCLENQKLTPFPKLINELLA